MVLACTYQWSAVRAYHYKVLQSIELGLMRWGDSFEPLKQPFFIPTALLPSPDPGSKEVNCMFASCVNAQIIAQSTAPSESFSSQQGVKTLLPAIELQDPSSTSQLTSLLDVSSSQPIPAPSSSKLRPLPIRYHLTAKLISMHSKLQSASCPNAFSLRLPVPSTLNIPKWRTQLRDYPDHNLCDFLEFGWPIGYSASTPPVSTQRNHGSALAQPHVIDAFLATETHLGATCGPFSENPLAVNLTTSPLQIVHSHSGKPRVVIDLSFPHGSSVNSGIPTDTYLGEPFTLRLPGVDALVSIIRQKGTGCHLFKKDLSRAYRQLRIDPRDFHFLGYVHHGSFYFDVAPPFGLRSSAMMCQRTTFAVTYMFQQLGYHCTNYINDFGGAEIPANSVAAFDALTDLLSSMGLQSSPDKDCPPSTNMVFLGIQLDTVAMTMSVTPDRLEELLHRCSSLLSLSHVTRRELQSLLGVMSFVTACVHPARIFMSSLLHTLRAHRDSPSCCLTEDNKSDLRWWCHFLRYFNGVSLIKISPIISDPLHLSTDACNTGAGGYFNGQYFHTPFPQPILQRFGADINVLELLTIMVALKLWGPALRGSRFILHCDNSNSVLAINSGRSRKLSMLLCLREIWFLSAFYNFEISAIHVPGRHNSLADHLSRWHLSPYHEAQFHLLTSHMTTNVTCPAQYFDFEISF